jgi:hypothetical protein
LVENDQEETFKIAVEKKCPYYEDLLPIFGDQSLAKSHCTSDNLNDVDDMTLEAEMTSVQKNLIVTM